MRIIVRAGVGMELPSRFLEEGAAGGYARGYVVTLSSLLGQGRLAMTKGRFGEAAKPFPVRSVPQGQQGGWFVTTGCHQ